MPGSTSQYNSLFSVSILGGDSNKTAITVDGGNIRNSIEGNTGMNFSQEVVEEFQLSSANFDLSTGITSVGAVNIVTRRGGNDLHGSGYFFFRNNDMAAYPALRRDPLNPDPDFSRQQSRRLGRRSDSSKTACSTSPTTNIPTRKAWSRFSRTWPRPAPSPACSRIPTAGTCSARASTGGRATTTPRSSASRTTRTAGSGRAARAALPSNWLRNENRSEQAVVGLTSIFTERLLNDFRFNFTYWRNRNLFADEATCGDCVGLGFPQLNINGTNVTVGNTSNATQGRDLYRYHVRRHA